MEQEKDPASGDKTTGEPNIWEDDPTIFSRLNNGAEEWTKGIRQETQEEVDISRDRFVRATVDTGVTYQTHYLKTSYALTQAVGALHYALWALENTPPGKHCIDRLKKDIAAIKEMLE